MEAGYGWPGLVAASIPGCPEHLKHPEEMEAGVARGVAEEVSLYLRSNDSVDAGIFPEKVSKESYDAYQGQAT